MNGDNGGTTHIKIEHQGNNGGTSINIIIHKQQTNKGSKRTRRNLRTNIVGDEHDNMVCIDYPLRNALKCVLFKPLLRVKTHVDYVSES